MMADTETPETATRALPSEPAAPRWLRIVMVVFLAAPQLLTGLWAVLLPARWFADFPGLGPALIAAEPPFNRHLATDAGAGFLAIGLCVAGAAWLGRVSACRLALITYLALEIPHVTYHVGHRVDALSGFEEAMSVAGILSGVAVALVFLWLLRPAVSPAGAGRSSVQPTAVSPTAGRAPTRPSPSNASADH